MSRDNKNHSPDWESPLENALWQISILDLHALSVEDKLKTMAAIFLTALDGFLANGGRAVIAQEAQGIYKNALAEIPALAADIRAMPREKIAQLIDECLPALNPQRALEQAHVRKLAVQELNGADLVLAAQALQTILPPMLKTLLLARGVIDNTPTAEWAKAMIRTIATTPATELAKTYNAAARQIPREAAIDRLHDITSHMTEQKLSALFGHVARHYTVGEFVDLAVSGLDALRHVLQDIVSHGVPTRMPAADRADVARWGQQAGTFLAVLEDALRAAGLSQDVYTLADLMIAPQNPPPSAPVPLPPNGPQPGSPAGPRP